MPERVLSGEVAVGYSHILYVLKGIFAGKPHFVQVKIPAFKHKIFAFDGAYIEVYAFATPAELGGDY